MAASLLPQAFPQRQPLPPNDFHPVNQHEAYQICLQHEDVASNEQHLIYARCLGYLLREIHIVKGRDLISQQILQCPKETNVLAELYINGLIRLFRQHSHSSPYHHSQLPFEMDASIESSPRDHSAAKRAALERDNFRCMITGEVDVSYYFAAQMNDDEQSAVNFQCTATNFCHIFPPSTNWNLNLDIDNHPKTKYSGSIGAIIESLGHIDVLTELDGDKIHSLSNGLTLGSTPHILFHGLNLWFEEQQGSPNTYDVKTLVPTIYERRITFTTATNLKLPDARYLRLHAAVCRVAHLSGAAGYLNYYDRKLEENDNHVLATDGSSADVLDSQLHIALLKSDIPSHRNSTCNDSMDH